MGKEETIKTLSDEIQMLISELKAVSSQADNYNIRKDTKDIETKSAFEHLNNEREREEFQEDLEESQELAEQIGTYEELIDEMQEITGRVE